MESGLAFAAIKVNGLNDHEGGKYPISVQQASASPLSLSLPTSFSPSLPLSPPPSLSTSIYPFTYPTVAYYTCVISYQKGSVLGGRAGLGFSSLCQSLPLFPPLALDSDPIACLPACVLTDTHYLGWRDVDRCGVGSSVHTAPHRGSFSHPPTPEASKPLREFQRATPVVYDTRCSATR